VERLDKDRYKLTVNDIRGSFCQRRLEFQIPAGSRSLFPHSQTAEMGRGLVLNRPPLAGFQPTADVLARENLPVVAFDV
jgi:hypothetical protein